jgi:hypothetical protein
MFSKSQTMKYKPVIYFILLLTCFFSFSLSAQESKARIENVTFEAIELEGTKVVVYYDILHTSPVERFEIELAFVDDEDFYYYPQTTTGDIGSGIKGGKQKRIVWDIFQDVDEVGRIKAIVNIASVTEEPGGAAYALLSIPVPGLGDVFVTNTKTAVIKPYYKTILSYGLVGYGMFQKYQSNKYYDDYNTSPDREDFDNLYNKANSANHQFYIFTGLGAAVWFSDVVWVAAKGISNSRKTDNSEALLRNRFTVTPNPYGGMNLGYVITF